MEFKTLEPLSRYFELIHAYPVLFQNTGPIEIIFDKDKIKNFMAETGRQIGVVFASPFNMLVVDLVQDINTGSIFCYERCIPSMIAGGCCVLAKYKEQFVLLKEYRHATRKFMYGIVKGFSEEGMSEEENIKKELNEELGAKVEKLKYLGNICANNGLSSGITKCYFAELKDINFEYNEGIVDYKLVNWEELENMIANGDIEDSFTLSAISLYKAKCKWVAK